ncbi:3D-(3,5/4)-trihydroxycyclohexane-1,2-dione acylhydrolase (decyclizing) [Commensalibacter papalotli (ex Botero et al. 2024)]|uniref:Myo-inositol metabolism (IolD) n=1 Tax=Commensalibacter papalotli (ex Botero et al. 2024) TaxID=2972766 RepID=A0ABM9HTU7_9PROT|nr:3D-(3,5/4)-trihydroxycyclohexane-1,2-dione acylhydrolase (decyclizing) [Commensalibacter papalotli (ex Botero et al. 2024)]CAI3956224.1 2-dione (THcHDO) dehydratase [Commensalibacter papalotli (ex Botero et al. 2024)]CAI3956376.1 2-dione (THcHDO) dehydratase [Commensalibacter papalotli (ex Botero et al. 2024)]
MKTIHLTMSQALVKAMMAQKIKLDDGNIQPFFAGMWAIFGHGNVAGLGEALHEVKDHFPTFRGQNEQGMAHTAIAFAKGKRRRQIMACTASIGPGSLNMITAAGVAHANRLPILLLPSDVFATRLPDPVLQQLEDFGDGTVSVNDSFKPVSRYFDRITRPEQIVPAFQRAMTVLTDPAECGPVTLSLCQDVQTMAWDFPETFFEEKIHYIRRLHPDPIELETAKDILLKAKKPLIIIGGGVPYSGAEKLIEDFCHKHGIPAGETNAGKSAIPDQSPLNMGGIGVSGTAAANALANEADVILAIGSRLQDFTTGSWAVFNNKNLKIIGLNIQPFDGTKHNSYPLIGDAKAILELLSKQISDYKADQSWTKKAKKLKADWYKTADKYMAIPAPTTEKLPSDAQVIGAVMRSIPDNSIVVCAAGGLPGELQKLWRAKQSGGYHMEYGFSCMGYEVAGGIGAKMAEPDRNVVVMVGDGSYLMLNSEIVSSVMLGVKITIVLLDNLGYGCINRLQQVCGGKQFNNMLVDTHHKELPNIDFVQHARGLGAISEKVSSVQELQDSLKKSEQNDRTTVIVIDTEAVSITEECGYWWDVAVPEVSKQKTVNEAYDAYLNYKKSQRHWN